MKIKLCFLIAATLAFAEVRLIDRSVVVLKKQRGNVTEAAMLPDGSFVIRSFDLEDLEYQAIEVFKANGDLQRVIGSKGWGPGRFYRLTGFDVAANGEILTLDAKGRISVFDANGALVRSVLPQVQLKVAKTIRAGIQPREYYLGGCLPRQTVDWSSCTFVHLLDAKDDARVRSALDSTPRSDVSSLFAYPRIGIDRARKRIFFSEGPSHWLYWSPPDLSRSDRMQIASKIAQARMPKGTLPASVTSSPRALDQMHRELTIYESVLISGDTMLLGLRSGSEYYGEVIDLVTMKQIGTDVPLPGNPVGVDKSGRFIFSSVAKGPKEGKIKTVSLTLGRFGR